MWKEDRIVSNRGERKEDGEAAAPAVLVGMTASALLGKDWILGRHRPQTIPCLQQQTRLSQQRGPERSTAVCAPRPPASPGVVLVNTEHRGASEIQEKQTSQYGLQRSLLAELTCFVTVKGPS